MSGRSFRSVFMVASCAGAALGCYLVSLRVASERASLEDVETKIALAQRDIRLLQTEIDTRGRLAQLERWNVKVLALGAPSADQFLEGGFALARMTRPQNEMPMTAPVVLASAPAPHPDPAPLVEGDQREDGAGATSPAAPLLRQASLKLPERETVTAEAAPRPAPRKLAEPVKITETKQKAAKAAESKPAPVKAQKAAETKPAVAAKKAGDKKVEAAAKPVTKPVRLAKVDPLAPLPAKANTKKTAKDSGTAR
jgi:hypothetical protein